VGWSLDVEVSSADVINGLIVQHDGNISVLKKRVGGKNGVIRLNNSSGDLRRGIDSESQLRLLTVVNGESLQKKRSETRSGTTSDGIEDQESLESSAVVSEFSDSVQAEIDDLSTNSVVTSGEVVGSILLTRDELLWVEELSVGSRSDLVNDGWLEIDHDTSWDVFSSSGFGEESAEGIIT
jgi:hypothetical protein